MIDLENRKFGEPPTTSDIFGHILSAISTVRSVLGKHSFEDFAGDRASRLALERLVEIISAASDHIPDDIKVTEAQVDWRTLSDMFVRLEDTRKRVEPEILWHIANETLIPLKACAISRTTKLR